MAPLVTLGQMAVQASVTKLLKVISVENPVQVDKQRRFDDALQAGQALITRSLHPKHSARLSLMLAAPTVEALVAGIAARTYTAQDIVCVYGQRVLDTHRRFNCVSEVLIQDAMDTAESLDRHFQDTGSLVGPLHGVPFAVTDDCDVHGADSTLGCSCGAMKPKLQDSPVVRRIRRLGGIILCKTSVPWHMLFADVVNPVYGASVHPTNAKLSLGGHSGALCALLSGSGCMVGIGTDEIGGLRIPAQHTGLYTLKPSLGRLPSASPTHAWSTLSSVPGPVASTLSDLIYTFKAMTSSPVQHTEPTGMPIPFDEAAFEMLSKRTGLRIGYVVDDGILHASPACKRAVFTAAAALLATNRGHKLIRFNPPAPSDALVLWTKLFSYGRETDGSPASKQCLRQVSAQQQVTQLEALFPFLLLMRVPQLVRSAAALAMGWLINDSVLTRSIRWFGGSPSWASLEERTFANTRDLEAERQAYARWFAESWDHAQLDVILCPVHACPPLPSVSTPFVWTGSFYSTLYSLLDYTAGFLPNLTRVSAADTVPNILQYVHRDPMPPANGIHVHGGNQPLDIPPQQQPAAAQPGAAQPPQPQPQPQQAQQPRAGHAARSRTRLFNFMGILGMEEVNHNVSDGTSVGQGVGVQIVCRRFEEEKVLAVMKAIEEGLPHVGNVAVQAAPGGVENAVNG
ncbi:amidase signature domain-containing protein [Entophlyctis helioformis]|nr:amidase signature domain-containing protein [Entophlyctis helioformis]